MGVLYICDEPTVGLHPADDYRLIETVQHLRDLGNTMLVVEHDEAMMRAADYIIDMGPGAGEHGGKVVATGDIDEIMANRKFHDRPVSVRAPKESPCRKYGAPATAKRLSLKGRGRTT